MDSRAFSVSLLLLENQPPTMALGADGELVPTVPLAKAATEARATPHTSLLSQTWADGTEELRMDLEGGHGVPFLVMGLGLPY